MTAPNHNANFSGMTTPILIADNIRTVDDKAASTDGLASLTKVGTSPAAIAVEIQSTTGGLVVPRMTETQRDAQTGFWLNGTMIFNLTTGIFNIFEGNVWIGISTAPGSGDVVGPASAVDNNIAVFSGTSGKLIQDGGVNLVNVGVNPAANLAPVTGNQMSNLSILELVTANLNTADCSIAVENANTLDTVLLARIFRSDAGGGDTRASMVFRSQSLNYTPTTPGAIVEIQSTESTFLNARMTEAQRNLIPSPADGMQIYQTDNTPGIYARISGSWTALSGGGGGSFPYREAAASPDISLYMGTGFNTTAVGINNLAAGEGALSALITGEKNISLGGASFFNIDNSSGNIGIGHNAASGVATQLTDCIFIGNNTGVANPILNNVVVIGGRAGGIPTVLGTLDDTMILGGAMGSSSALNVGIGTATPRAALTVIGGHIEHVTTTTGIGTYDVLNTDYIIESTRTQNETINLPNVTADTIGQIYIVNDNGGDPAYSLGVTAQLDTDDINGAPSTVFITKPYGSMGLYQSAGGYITLWNDSVSYITGLDTGNLPSDNLFIGIGAGNNTFTTATGNVGIALNALADLTTGNVNVAIGPGALNANTTGSRNLAIGGAALNSNISGNNNIALGNTALFNTTIVDDLIAIGYQSLISNTSGTFNIAIGTASLNTNTTGLQNLAIGHEALSQNNANQNIAIGYHAMQFNTTGASNIAIGTTALNSNSSGALNLAIGNGSLSSNSTGNFNLAVGQSALSQNTGGTQNLSIGYNSLSFSSNDANNIAIGGIALNLLNGGSSNIALGWGALSLLTTGNSNFAAGFNALTSLANGSDNFAAGSSALANATTGPNFAAGYRALQATTTGVRNTAIGRESLTANSTGNDNVALGDGGLFNLTTGSFNISIGNNALLSVQAASKNTAIGYGSLDSNIFLDDNIAVGFNSLSSLTTAATLTKGDNICIGNLSGNTVTTASGLILIGSGITAADSLTNAVAIGDSSQISVSNAISLGASGVNVGINGVDSPLTALHVNGGLTFSVTATAGATYVVLTTDYTIAVTPTTTSTVTLLDATTNEGQYFVIKDVEGSATANPITIDTVSGLIDGATTATIAGDYGSLTVFSNGVDYFIV